MIDGGCHHLIKGRVLRADLESREDSHSARYAHTHNGTWSLVKVLAGGIFIALALGAQKTGTILEVWQR